MQERLRAAIAAASLATALLLRATSPSAAAADEPVDLRSAIDKAIHRGVAYLVKSQNKSGSWGTPAPSLVCDVWSPVPSCFQTYEVGVTAMAVSSLLEVGGNDPGVAEALKKATDWLVANHPVKRVEPGHLYNVWTHSYTLEAFARLAAHEKDETKRAAWRAEADKELDRLKRYEYVDGGWGYYDFSFRTEHPGRGSTSFMTATVLTALKMAADQGVAVPDRLVQRGLKILDLSRGPDDSFAYSYSSPYSTHVSPGVNHQKGSLARTPACLVAMQNWGRAIEETRVHAALDELEKYGHFLLIARKYPYPHEAWYQNSGYFCFYGYYYASLLKQLLPPEARPREEARIVSHLLPLQEPEGSWWDWQLFGYHKTYGTAYVLMTLGRCRDAR